MRIFSQSLLAISLCGLFTINSFAAAAFCNAINQRTGQHFMANSQAPWPGKAMQIARKNVMWKCHRFSRGWPGMCIVQRCNVAR